MGHFLWETTSDVPPQKALEWWFDMRESDHAGHHHSGLYRKPATRKVLSRSADTVVVEDDFGQGPPMQATVKRVGQDALSTQYASKLYGSTGTVTFAPQGAGSRIRLQFVNEWKGFGKLLGVFMQKPMESMIRKDLDAHAKDLDEEWRAKPW